MIRKTTGTVTIDHVASAAKVSIATVSRALNRPETVSTALREKINNVIKKLGYIPNAGARSLMLKRSGTIGAIVPTLDNAIFAQGLAEFQKQLNQAGYQLLVASTNYDPVIESTQINNLLSRGVEGVALFGSSQEKDALKLLKTRSIPYIHVGTLSTPLNGFASGFDNREAIKLGVEHLLGIGHQHFGILTGITANNDRANDRVQGALELLAQKKINLKPEVIVECNYDLQEARLGLKKLLLSNPKITAIICGQDVLALGAMLEAQSQGIKIPKELSIIGFDDLEISRHLIPSLTTIHIDAIGMWAQAANHLISQINGVESLPRKINTAVNLVIRGSSSAAGKYIKKSQKKATP
ncbi:LacI family DNA-binding transcriptional regulator [Polynucleobacter sp. CS-Odin-A6]|uniref:LacI family DNA-binding transcriptional regulator n=1 Tax=Polynucleobacter sp. CS-Odin-A6 TaxID=2689106 RepID=UPI001C0BD11F|nr:LacI family DNA-binding transcriptional regulator [Polynucleobacter sp. CS-Odin-A6]MBU3620661.1 LacI family DNA-binding transcriptional regulator [Polynucleobacter sp. CS-Odin-A6]